MLVRRLLRRMARAPGGRSRGRALSSSGEPTPTTRPAKELLLTSLQFTVPNKAGGLLAPLAVFQRLGINLLHLQPRATALRHQGPAAVTMFCDLEGHVDQPVVQQCLDQLRSLCLFATVVGSYRIPAYPSRIQDLDLIEQRTLGAGEDLLDDPESPHPGFHDQEYRSRRRTIVQRAFEYRHGMQGGTPPPSAVRSLSGAVRPDARHTIVSLKKLKNHGGKSEFSGVQSYEGRQGGGRGGGENAHCR